MNTGSKDKLLNRDGSRLATAEQRLRQLGIKLPAPPEPFGIYAEAVQTGNMLFLTGMFDSVSVLDALDEIEGFRPARLDRCPAPPAAWR